MDELKLLENELVPVYTTSTGEKIVYGTELHEALGVKSNFSTWAKRRFSECDAEENKDYQVCFPNLESENNGGKNKTEYIIQLDTAKEMAMLERNEVGKKVRRYFIKIDEKYKDAVSGMQMKSAGIDIKMYKNNKWYVLVMGDDVYSLSPSEAENVSHAIAAMVQNNVAQIVDVVRSMLCKLSHGKKLQCTNKCAISDMALIQSAQG